MVYGIGFTGKNPQQKQLGASGGRTISCIGVRAWTKPPCRTSSRCTLRRGPMENGWVMNCDIFPSGDMFFLKVSLRWSTQHCSLNRSIWSFGSQSLAVFLQKNPVITVPDWSRHLGIKIRPKNRWANVHAVGVFTCQSYTMLKAEDLQMLPSGQLSHNWKSPFDSWENPLFQWRMFHRFLFQFTRPGNIKKCRFSCSSLQFTSPGADHPWGPFYGKRGRWDDPHSFISTGILRDSWQCIYTYIYIYLFI